jgi:hypothetical protein
MIKEAIATEPIIWLREEKIKNEKGLPIQIERESNHFFLRQLYLDDSKKIVVRKPSQVGVSVWAVLTEFHAAKYWGINQIHTLPTAHDVGVFVPDKVNQMIRMNPSIKAGIPEKEVDAIAQKQFGKAFVYFKGTVSKRETFMLTSDRNTYDEVDRSNTQEIANYSSRLEGASSLGMERWISTPTMPGFGIDRIWDISDQKHWRFACGKCNTEQHMEWPANIDMENARYICSSCAAPLKDNDIRNGEWRARFPEREISGYWITQMIAPWITPENIIKTYRECEDGINEMTLEYFYNHKLGQPYVSMESQIPATLFYRNLTKGEHTEIKSVMGVDVQLRELYVIVGSEDGVYGILILKDDSKYVETEGQQGISKWDRLQEIMDIYDVRYGVIDGGFMPNDVVKFARKNEGKIYVNWYKEDPKKMELVRFGEDVPFTQKQKDTNEDIKVLSDRNRMIDQLLESLKKGNIRFHFTQNDERIQQLVEHSSRVYARIAPDRFGIEKREWVSTGKDDFLHALVYYLIAIIKKQKTEE